jgi:hypothetical protein
MPSLDALCGSVSTIAAIGRSCRGKTIRNACDRDPFPAHGVSVSRNAAPSSRRMDHESNRRFSPFAPTSWTPPATSA